MILEKMYCLFEASIGKVREVVIGRVASGCCCAEAGFCILGFHGAVQHRAEPVKTLLAVLRRASVQVRWNDVV